MEIRESAPFAGFNLRNADISEDAIEIITEQDSRIRYLERLLFLVVAAAGGVSVPNANFDSKQALVLNIADDGLNGTKVFTVTPRVVG